MDCTLKWRAPPPKYSKCKLALLLMAYNWFYFCSGDIQLNATVKEKAELSCNYNISHDELKQVRIYWQKINEVVLTVTDGVIKVGPTYKNRTIPVLSYEPSIMILALRLSDSGCYTCVIQKKEKGAYRVVHIEKMELSVRADFPVPRINDIGNLSLQTKRIKCSTSGGFPKPHLSWWENDKELNATSTSISQDPETELYAINSELDFNVTDNHNFTCLVKYGDSTVSNTYKWKKEKHPDNNPVIHWGTGHTIGTIGLAVGLVTCIVFAVRKHLLHGPEAGWREGRENTENREMKTPFPTSPGSSEALP